MSTQSNTRLLLDVDMGVDDAVAVGWLLSQDRYPVSIAGITTVAGNTTVENVTRNVAALLEIAGHSDLPLVQGAAAPLEQPLGGTGVGVHGPDGLWFAARGHASARSVGEDAPAFIADLAAPDLTLVSLGPLTNIAHTLRRYPEKLRAFQEIIVLGGARYGGNRTPLAEFNIWSDPRAASEILAAGLPLTLIPLDAFSQFTLTTTDVEAFAHSPNPVAQFLAGPLQRYVQIQVGRGRSHFRVPDVVAVLYTLDRALGKTTPALVRVIPGIDEEGPARLLRGQTVVGISPDEKMTMLAGDRELSALAQQIVSEPGADIPAAMGAILGRSPGEVELLLEIDAAGMRHRLLQGWLQGSN